MKCAGKRKPEQLRTAPAVSSRKSNIFVAEMWSFCAAESQKVEVQELAKIAAQGWGTRTPHPPRICVPFCCFRCGSFLGGCGGRTFYGENENVFALVWFPKQWCSSSCQWQFLPSPPRAILPRLWLGYQLGSDHDFLPGAALSKVNAWGMFGKLIGGFFNSMQVGAVDLLFKSAAAVAMERDKGVKHVRKVPHTSRPYV